MASAELAFEYLAAALESTRGTAVTPPTHYFPFTEPSMEPDVSCGICGGSGCRTCRYSGWIEMGGSGMVDPRVFENVGVDPEQWSGFAFGLGLSRLVMLRYKIDDVRRLLAGDVRFLEQFS